MIDTISELAQEKRNLKSTFTPGFNNELTLILEKCFLQTKYKKEHFITVEKLQVELIKLLSSQKRFSSQTSLGANLKNLSIFNIKDNTVENILNIDFLNQKIKTKCFFGKEKEIDFSDVKFFDKTTLESEIFYKKQSQVYDGISYKKFVDFLYS